MTQRPDEPEAPRPEDLEPTMDSSGEAPTTSREGPAHEQPVASHATDMVGKKIGRYTIKSIIGSGGMGTVFQAQQEQPRRRVAIKMMKRGITSRSALRRFEFESQLLARLQHPGIAQVYEAGTHDDGAGGVPYFVMEYIPNAKTLTEYATDKKLGTRDRLAIFAKVCDAVQHGHLKGIVHRDLKPGNILVDSSGQPKIIDFGVARSTDSDMAVTTLQTDIGQLVGTIQYMSPEQVEADPSDIDARSDVYALGVILYELLTNSLPYDVAKAAIHEAVRMVREEEPTKLSTIDRHLRGDVETIALKALEKDRDRRYQSAVELEQDIERYLDGETISARRPTAWYHMKRFARRHKAASIAISAVFIVLVGAVVIISVFAAEAQHQRMLAIRATDDAVNKSLQLEFRNLDLLKMQQQAMVQAATAKSKAIEAEQQRDEARRQAYMGNIHAADAAIGTGSMSAAHQRLAAAREALGNVPPEQLPFEWNYLRAQSDDAMHTLLGHEQEVLSVTFSSDGTRLASGSWDETIRLWDAETGEELSILRGHQDGVTSVAFSPDGRRLASGSWDYTIRIWDTDSGEELSILGGLKEPAVSVTFSPNGTLLASGSMSDVGDATIHIWSTAAGKVLRTMLGHTGQISSVAFSPDGTRLASGSWDETIRLWDVASGDELRILRGHTGTVQSVAFSPDGRRLASGSWGDAIRLWDVASGDELRILRGHTGTVQSVAFSPDGTRLASGSEDKTIRLWDANTGKELCTLRGHEDRVNSITFSPDGTSLASASHDRTVRLWDTDAGKVVVTELPMLGEVTYETSSVAFSPNGRLLASGNYDHTIHLRDIDTGEELCTLAGHEHGVLSVTFSPDGTRLASGSWDETIRLWDAETGEELSILRGHQDGVTSVAFSPDGRRLASASSDDTIRLWDAETGEELSILRGHQDGVTSVAFSPDGRRLASASSDDTIRLWNTNSGEELNTLREHGMHVFWVSFSPDGTRLASGSWDETIRLWDAETGEELSILRGHQDGVTSVAFSPDGRRLASASSDDTIRLWDAETGEELNTLRGHEDGVTSVAFSPDGTRLASEGWHIQLWDTRSRSQIAHGRRLARQRVTQLAPLVEGWIDKSDGDNELVLAMLDREVKNRSPEEATTLRNLVLKKLSEHRQAKEAEADEPVVP